jgi:hypothetical protein
VEENTSLQLRSSEQYLVARSRYFSELPPEEQEAFAKRFYYDLKGRSLRRPLYLSLEYLPEMFLVLLMVLARWAYRNLVGDSPSAQRTEFVFFYTVGILLYLSIFLKSLLYLLDRKIIRQTLEELEKYLSSNEKSTK